jgi:hypothetical protein
MICLTLVSTGYIHGYYSLGPANESAPGSLPRYAQRLRDSRTAQQDVQLDGNDHKPGLDRDPMEHTWHFSLLPLLVLDSGLRQRQSWLHVFVIRHYIPSVLHYIRHGRCRDVTERRDCGPSLQFSLLFCYHFVS